MISSRRSGRRAAGPNPLIVVALYQHLISFLFWVIMANSAYSSIREGATLIEVIYVLVSMIIKRGTLHDLLSREVIPFFYLARMHRSQAFYQVSP